MSKSNWCCISSLHDWFKKLAPLFHPIRGKTKTNRVSVTRVFPRFASVRHVTASNFDWFTVLPKPFLIGYSDNFGFWFCDTQLNNNNNNSHSHNHNDNNDDNENDINDNNDLILILRAFHEMIKRALHDFYLNNSAMD